ERRSVHHHGAGDDDDVAPEARRAADHRHRGRFRLSDRSGGPGAGRGGARIAPVRLLRPTLRIRLALLYGGGVLLVGASLLVASIVLMDRAITRLGFFNYQGTVTFRDNSGNTKKVLPSQLATEARHETRDYLLHTGLIYFAVIVIIGAAGGYLLARQ